MAALKHVTNEAGDHFIGVDVDGTFIAFGTVTAARVAQLQERAADLTAKLEAGDKAAEEAVALLPISSKGGTADEGEKGGKS